MEMLVVKFVEKLTHMLDLLKETLVIYLSDTSIFDRTDRLRFICDISQKQMKLSANTIGILTT
jgi:hypothetical protein